MKTLLVTAGVLAALVGCARHDGGGDNVDLSSSDCMWCGEYRGTWTQDAGHYGSIVLYITSDSLAVGEMTDDGAGLANGVIRGAISNDGQFSGEWNFPPAAKASLSGVIVETATGIDGALDAFSFTARRH